MLELDRPTFQKLWSRDQWSGLPVNRSWLSPLMFLERSVHVYNDKVAVVDGSRRYTYGHLGERVYRLASALRKRASKKAIASRCSPTIPTKRSKPTSAYHRSVPCSSRSTS